MPAIFFAIFVDVLGFGIILPILPFLNLQYGGDAFTGTGLVAIFSLTAFISAPLWGRLSDRIGRRPCMALTFVGGIASYLFLATADSLLMLYLARAMSGAMAGNVAIAMASVADHTTPENRGRMMGFFGGTYGLAFAMGPGIGGLLSGPADNPSIMVPALIAAGTSAVACLVTLIFMKESNRHRDSNNKPRKRASLREIIKSKLVLMLLIQFVIAAVIQSTVFSITPFWSQAVLGWNQIQVGYLMMAMGFIIFLVQTFIVPWFFKRIGEASTYRGGLIFGLIASILMIVAPDGTWKAWLCIVTIAGSSTIAFPVLNSMLSRRSASDTQGAALGLGNGLSALGRMAGPIFAGTLFEGINPSAPFFLIMILCVVAIAWTNMERRNDKIALGKQ